MRTIMTLMTLFLAMAATNLHAETRIIEYPDRIVVEVIGAAEEQDTRDQPPPSSTKQGSQPKPEQAYREPVKQEIAQERQSLDRFADTTNATYREDRETLDPVRRQIADLRTECTEIRRNARPYESEEEYRYRQRQAADKMREIQRLEAVLAQSKSQAQLRSTR
jgi:hypothetical protein